MNKKFLGSLLLGLCFFVNSSFATLPKEGVYEKHSSSGALEARMYVMGTKGKTQYTFGYGNNHAQVIWLEGYSDKGYKHAEFATRYIWKNEEVGAAETALILDQEQIGNLKNGDLATPSYAKDMASFSFNDSGVSKVWVRKDFVGEPTSWKDGQVADTFSGTYNYVASGLKFTPVSMAFAWESTSNIGRFYDANRTNAEWNQAKLRINATGLRFEFLENLMEQGLLVKLDAALGKSVNMNSYTGRGVLTGSEVRMRANTTTNARIIGLLDLNEAVKVLGYEKGLDGRGWYYIEKENGLLGFAAAQFIDLR